MIEYAFSRTVYYRQVTLRCLTVLSLSDVVERVKPKSKGGLARRVQLGGEGGREGGVSVLNVSSFVLSTSATPPASLPRFATTCFLGPAVAVHSNGVRLSFRSEHFLFVLFLPWRFWFLIIPFLPKLRAHALANVRKNWQND